jgi:ComF family protein
MFESIVNFFFPTTCLFCSSGEKIICDKCFFSIPKDIQIKKNILSIYNFRDEKVNKLLWRLKYHHTGDIAKIFGKVLAEEFSTSPSLSLQRRGTEQKIFLVPIPLNQGDKRMHNHAELIANSLATNLVGDCEVIPDLLIKNSKIKQAHTKSKSERFENIKNCFTISTSPNLSLQRRGIVHNSPENLFVLVDDVSTTGSTINEARKVLAKYLEIPEKEIFAITVAH